MKIALISPHYGPPWNEGVRNMARCLVEFLQCRGEEVFVVSRKSMAETGPVMALLGKVPGLRSMAFSTFAMVHARKLRPDRLILLSSLSTGLGVKCYLLQKIVGSPVILYVTGLRPVRLGYRFLLRPDKTIVNSEFLKSFIDDAEVIPPFIDAKKFRRKEGPDKNAGSLVLFLGAFEKCRGVEYLIRAMGTLNGRVNAKLLLAWNGMGRHRYRHILKTIRESRAESKIELVKGGDVADLYSRASVVVIPRVSPERMAFPIRILEAVTVGVPLIVSRINGMEQIVEGCGVAVEPRNEKALAEAIERVLTDRELYLSLAEGCREKAKLWYSEKNLQRLYQAVL